MGREQQSHFGYVAKQDIQRSKFRQDWTNKTSYNLGDIIPLFVNTDILPGDTWNVKTKAIIRLATPDKPAMDNLFQDCYWFAIPYRLLWKHTKEFFGENTSGAWGQTTEYEIPYMKADATNGVATGTICDYMGIPKGVKNLEFNALGVRAYIKTINEWFRNQNLTAPYTEYDDDTTRVQDNTNPVLGGLPIKAMKFPDYLTTCLPESQKPYANIGNGSGVSIPLGVSAPITYTGTNNSGQPVYPLIKTATTTNSRLLYQPSGEYQIQIGGTDHTDGETIGSGVGNQMLADLTAATAASINALRLAFQTQKLLESMAVGGTRYTEIIKKQFSVTSPDARQQRPEYLGGMQQPIQMNTVAGTNQDGTTGPLGDLAAFSQTNGDFGEWTKSFTEHTVLLCLGVVRNSNTYQQNLHRMWSRRKLLDFYTPVLAHLGEQPVYKKEVMAVGPGVGSTDDTVFGYQERWAEYKYGHEIITGELNSAYATPLDSWHYADYYSNVPTLGTTWLSANKAYLNRTLAVTSHNQFIADWYAECVAVRPMPIYCTPGLIDHF